MQPYISIITPIYNVERFIERCAESLFNQTLSDGVEFIFINDCSTDNGLNILRKCIRNHPERSGQVRIIEHEENKGVAISRQDGINVASGEYIIHVDPDDWVDIHFCENLYLEAVQSSADIVICDYFEASDLEVKGYEHNFESLKSISLLEAISGRKNKAWGVLWNKLIRTEIYKKYSFEPEINFCEDVLMLFKILSKDYKISHLPEKLYYYRKIRQGSEKRQISADALSNDLILFETINQLAVGSNSIAYKDCCKSFIQEQIISRAFRYSRLSDKEYKQRYGRYFKIGQYNHTFPFLIYQFANLSAKGYHKLSVGIYGILNRILTIFLKFK